MIYLALGTNLGDRHANLDRAIDALNANEIEVVKRSSRYETAPLYVRNQPWFLNMVVECRTRLFPLQLINRLLRVERELGRQRGPLATPKGPRLIDLDILLYNNAVIETPRLTIPHPRMLERRFVLEPLLEVAPEIKDPRNKRPIASALAPLRGQKITKLEN